MHFLRAATRNLSPKSSAQSKDFNLKRLLFCRGNHGRLFQQNRTFSVGHGHKACWSNPMQTVVRSNADRWSSEVQFASGGSEQKLQTVLSVGHVLWEGRATILRSPLLAFRARSSAIRTSLIEARSAVFRRSSSSSWRSSLFFSRSAMRS